MRLALNLNFAILKLSEQPGANNRTEPSCALYVDIFLAIGESINKV